MFAYYDVFVALTNDSSTQNIISNFICFSIAEKLCKAISNNNICPMMKPVRDGSLSEIKMRLLDNICRIKVSQLLYSMCT